MNDEGLMDKAFLGQNRALDFSAAKDAIMICLSANTVIRDEKPVARITAQVSEHDLYEEAASTLEGVREIIRSSRLPKKRMQLPSPPFVVGILDDCREVVIESVEAWEGDFPGKRFVLISRDVSDDLGWLVGKNLELRPLPSPKPSSAEDRAAMRYSEKVAVKVATENPY